MDNCLERQRLRVEHGSPALELPSTDRVKSVEQGAMPHTTPTTSVEAAPNILSLTVPQSSPALPPRPEFIPFTVPNLGASAPYDRQDFWAYPARHKWLVHARDEQCHALCPPGECREGKSDSEYDRGKARPPMFSRADGSPVTATDKVAFLQTWLFFGTLHEMSSLCGLSLDVDVEFLVDNAQRVSTSALNGLAGRWFSALRTDQRGNLALMERILALARHLALMINEEFRADAEPMFDYSLDESRVLHSLDVLVSTLGLHLLLHVYTPTFHPDDEDGWSRNRITRSLNWNDCTREAQFRLSGLVWDDMASRGWCESELYLMAPVELAFASLLDRPRVKQHHKSCTDIVCYAYQTDEATYRTVHVDDNCDCDFVCVPTDALVNLLAQDKVPAVIITGELDILVVDSADSPYVALSHVWADGLGNPRENALPKCQLRRLRDYADTLYRMHRLATPTEHHMSRSTTAVPVTCVAFWMDTLCIPVHPSAKPLRKKAIELLGQTFHQASAVLVLERELELASSSTSSFLELGIRILCSGWVKRLWTLQEATLASEALGEDKIYFQMQDGPFLYQKYDHERKAAHAVNEHTTEIQVEERQLLCENGIMILLGEQIPSVRAMRNMREGWSPFRVVFSAIEHRTSSKLEDIPLCITSLLGKDVSFILSAVDGEQRMANFYMLMREIPEGMVWTNGIAKLGVTPFRWAPASLASCPPATAIWGWPNVICDAAGLHVRYPGFFVGDIEPKDYHRLSPLPSYYKLISAESTETIGYLWYSASQQAVNLPSGATMAVIVRSARGRGMQPTAAIVLLEDNSGSDTEGEIETVCTIFAYFYIAVKPPPRRVEDQDGIVNVSAKDKATNKDQSMTIASSSGLSDKEIERMIDESEKFAEQDTTRKQLIEESNRAESVPVCNDTEKAMNDWKDLVECGTDLSEPHQAERAAFFAFSQLWHPPSL